MKSIILILSIVLTMNSNAQTFDCDQIITSKVDKITGELTKNSSSYPFKGSYALIPAPASYVRVIKDGDTTTYISLIVFGTTLNVGENGVTLLLANGVKIERPDAKIDYSSDTYAWRYSAFFALEKDEIELIKNNDVEMIRLYIYDADYSYPDESVKYAKVISKNNAMMRAYMKEAIICITQ
jgi:hypothetical protein